VSLWEKKTSGRKWSPDFCCMTPPIWISEASVARESSAFGAGCWRGTAATRRRFAFWNASCAEMVHSNILVPPFRRSVKGFTICAIRAENRGKSLPCPENVAAAWYPEGVSNFLFWGCDWPWGLLLSPKSSGQEFQEKVLQTHIFSKLMARPLAAAALKKASRWWRCVCLSGEPTHESSIYANTTSKPSVGYPYKTSPHKTSPHKTSPHKTSPHKTSPHKTSPVTKRHPTKHHQSQNVTSNKTSPKNITSNKMSPDIIAVSTMRNKMSPDIIAVSTMRNLPVHS
jgi:hypothetical protein